MKVQKKTLLVIAGLVWLLAGVNIMKIGVDSADGSWSALMLALAAVTYLVFHNLVFRRMVVKHTRRITGYGDNLQPVLRFFDRNAYCIMFFMLTVGVSLRAFHLWPDVSIATFYTGLGFSLVIAGVSFFLQYRRYARKAIPSNP